MADDFKLRNPLLDRITNCVEWYRGGNMKGLLRAGLLATLIFVGALISGCCSGGSSDVKTETTATTLGSELKDLKDAYDQGIISEKEYNEAREKILKQRTKSN